MKKILQKKGILMVVTGCMISFACMSQVQTPRSITTTRNSHGFYEYLPQGYSSSSIRYPLLLALHGAGDLGNGTSELPRVLNFGLPKLIAEGGFPSSFVSGGSTFRFIVISPQFIEWPVPGDVDAVLDYVIRNYRVDVNRIYLTGLSMGGGAVWEYAGYNSTYARKIAGIVPICGASTPNRSRAQVIAAANIAVWATHNLGDDVIPVSYTNDYITLINSSNPPPNPLAKKTIFQASGHDASLATYNPSFSENGMNIYQYLLQFQRNTVALPVVLSDYKAFLNNNNTVLIHWQTTSEFNNRNFLVERSADGINFSIIEDIPATNNSSGNNYSVTDSKPLQGNNFYRLSQIDVDGKTTYFSVLKVVVPIASSEQIFRISPNPVVHTLKLEVQGPKTGMLQVRMTDIQGQLVRIWNFKKLNFQWQQSLDVSGIPRGTYVINLIGENINEIQRLIIQ